MPASLNIRLPPHKAKTLEAYAAATQRTKSEIVREFIRTLPSAKVKSMIVAKRTVRARK
jgi:predicted DNA-binding protein